MVNFVWINGYFGVNDQKWSFWKLYLKRNRSFSSICLEKSKFLDRIHDPTDFKPDWRRWSIGMYSCMHCVHVCRYWLYVCMQAMLVDSCVWLLIHIWVCIDVNINTGKRFLMCSINASFESQFPPLLPWRTRQSYPHIRQFSSLSTNLELFMQSCPPNNAICAAFPTLLFTLKCTI